MAYQSPYKLLLSVFDDITVINDAMLLKLRKKMLAEFNLYNRTTIIINNIEYTKDEVLKLIDGFRQIQDHEVHYKIFNNPEVLTFLENPTKEGTDDSVVFEWLNVESNSTHLKSLLIDAELEKSKYLFSRRRYKILTTQFEHLYKLNDTSWNMTFDEILLKHHSNNVQLIHACGKEQNELHMPEHLKWLMEKDWTIFYCFIQPHHPQTMDDMLHELINLTVYMHEQNYSKKEYVAISYLLKSLPADEGRKRLIDSNHEVFTMSSSSGNSKPFVGVFVVIVFVIFAFKLLNLGGRKKRWDFKNYNIPTAPFDTNTFLRPSDTVFEQNNHQIPKENVSSKHDSIGVDTSTKENSNTILIPVEKDSSQQNN